MLMYTFEFYHVDEKMPVMGSDVLVFTPYRDEMFFIERVYNMSGKPAFGRGWNKGETFEITHWAYIPDKIKSQLMKPQTATE